MVPLPLPAARRWRAFPPGKWWPDAPVLLVVLGTLLVSAAWAVPEGLLIPLECRLEQGPWQDCQMRVDQVGAQWWLLIGERQLEFRHDGSGTVTMQGGPGEGGGWRPVSSRWEEDASLCWNGICAKGDIPLD